MQIGEKIKYYRDLNNLTQDDLAKKIQTSPQNIYKYEKGIVTNIPLEKIKKIAEVFNISPTYLTGWKDEKAEAAPKVGDGLTDTEQKLLAMFSCLSEDQQLLLLAQIETLLKYQK